MKPDLDWSLLTWRQAMELDACARCGECQLWCPVFEKDQREGVLPRSKARVFKRLMGQDGNRLQRMLAGKALGKAEVEQAILDLYECSVCGQCQQACPISIDTAALWEALRAVAVKSGLGPLPPHLALAQSIEDNENPWQQPRSSRDRWATRAAKGKSAEIAPVPVIGPEGAEVLLFVGCTAALDMNLKQVAVSTAKVLQAADVDFAFLGRDEPCCGSVMLRVGLRERFAERAARNIEYLNGLGIQSLVTSCSGCFKTIGQDYPEIAPLNFEVVHVSEYLVRLLEQDRLVLENEVPRIVTYHDPCHLGRHSGVYDAPREVLSRIPGLEVREMERSREDSRCCGAGGGLKAGFPQVQAAISETRIEEAESTGADTIVSACPFCYQGLRLGIAARGSSLRMTDLTELVAAAVGAQPRDALTAETEADSKET